MWKYILIGVAFIALVRLGYHYVLSDQFQEYADREEAQWTCHVNNNLGGIYMFVNNYNRAIEFYTPVIDRCPESSASELAEFRIAQCYDKKGYLQLAIKHFEIFLEKYPASERAKTAEKTLGFLKNS